MEKSRCYRINLHLELLDAEQRFAKRKRTAIPLFVHNTNFSGHICHIRITRLVIMLHLLQMPQLEVKGDSVYQSASREFRTLVKIPFRRKHQSTSDHTEHFAGNAGAGPAIRDKHAIPPPILKRKAVRRQQAELIRIYKV